MQRPSESGFHVVGLVIAFLALIILGFVGLRVLQSDGGSSGVSNKDSVPVWEYDQSKLEWVVKGGNAPACKDPFKLDLAPVDMTKISSVTLPGAYRGFSYKAHGGFRAKENTAGKVNVVMPMDANLRQVTRYYEAIPGQPDELQYLLTFENDCGIAFRFDHLYTLTPEFQAIADKSPPPKKDDTRTDPNAERLNIPFKAGTVVATTVGFPAAKNYGFDFGVYDYRKRNDISNNTTWAKIHEQFSALDYHGICWLPLLPGKDANTAEAMAKDRNNYDSSKPFNLVSDYCEFAPYKTLDFNNGQPTEG